MKTKTTYKRVTAWVVVGQSGSPMYTLMSTQSNVIGRYFVYKDKADAEDSCSVFEEVVSATITYALPKALKVNNKK